VSKRKTKLKGNAIDKESKDIEKMGVWNIIDEINIPINHGCIKNNGYSK
jgi:hypothetical protein